MDKKEVEVYMNRFQERLTATQAVEILVKRKYFGQFEYYKYRIGQFFKLIPCVIRALGNTFSYMIEVWKDMNRWENIWKD